MLARSTTELWPYNAANEKKKAGSSRRLEKISPVCVQRAVGHGVTCPSQGRKDNVHIHQNINTHCINLVVIRWLGECVCFFVTVSSERTYSVGSWWTETWLLGDEHPGGDSWRPWRHIGYQRLPDGGVLPPWLLLLLLLDYKTGPWRRRRQYTYTPPATFGYRTSGPRRNRACYRGPSDPSLQFADSSNQNPPDLNTNSPFSTHTRITRRELNRDETPMDEMIMKINFNNNLPSVLRHGGDIWRSALASNWISALISNYGDYG